MIVSGAIAHLEPVPANLLLASYRLSPVRGDYPVNLGVSPLAIIDMLDRNYRCISVDTQFSHDSGLAQILHRKRKILTQRVLNKRRIS